MGSKWIMDTERFIPPLAACSYSKTAATEQSFFKKEAVLHTM
jgi:hypothetical protein